MSLPAPSKLIFRPEFPSRLRPRSTAVRYWASRALSNCLVKATCSIWLEVGESAAFMVPLYPTMKLKKSSATSSQGQPHYLDAVTADDELEGEDSAIFDSTGMGGAEGGDLYEQAVQIVTRDRKASTSYIQRRLQIGYNRAASLIERMEREGVVGQPNHAGKREILVGGEDNEGY